MSAVRWKILWIDDDLECVVPDILRNAGFEVDAFKDVLCADDAVGPYDAVFLDWHGTGAAMGYERLLRLESPIVVRSDAGRELEGYLPVLFWIPSYMNTLPDQRIPEFFASVMTEIRATPRLTVSRAAKLLLYHDLTGLLKSVKTNLLTMTAQAGDQQGIIGEARGALREASYIIEVLKGMQ